GERLPIGGYRLVHLPLLGVDGRERPQSGHASTAIERHRANRERALEELARALPVAQRVIVHANSVEAIRLIAWRLNLLREGKRAIIKTQRLVEVPKGVVGKRCIGDRREKDAWIGFRADIGQRALEPAQRLRQTSQ